VSFLVFFFTLPMAGADISPGMDGGKAFSPYLLSSESPLPATGIFWCPSPGRVRFCSFPTGPVAGRIPFIFEGESWRSPVESPSPGPFYLEKCPLYYVSHRRFWVTRRPSPPALLLVVSRDQFDDYLRSTECGPPPPPILFPGFMPPALSPMIPSRQHFVASRALCKFSFSPHCQTSYGFIVRLDVVTSTPRATGSCPLHGGVHPDHTHRAFLLF